MAEEIQKISHKEITFKGFSSKADKRNFKIYDFECSSPKGVLIYPIPTDLSIFLSKTTILPKYF